ncbi:glycosyltransferase family 2 protein [Candidatus Woesearchaeota archaeon]|nr:glycosyltransferase family 2 protein [Candidatus Woesearchaeota archaeon]
MKKPLVSAIIPAYNEAPRIGNVLDVLANHPLIKEVIVVDDGSTDNLKAAIRSYRVRYVRIRENKGKGYAMERGVRSAKGDIILFCDADVTGLNKDIIMKIIEPVLNGKREMYIAVRNHDLLLAFKKFGFFPLLSGERALTKRLWNRVPPDFKRKFRIETALNFYARQIKGIGYRVFPQLTQTIKERKYGILEGAFRRLGMCKDVVLAFVMLRLRS